MKQVKFGNYRLLSPACFKSFNRNAYSLMWWPNKQILLSTIHINFTIHSFPFRHSPFQNFKTAVLVLQRKLIKFGENLVSRYYKLNEIYVERKIVITSYFPDFALQKTSSAVTVMGSTAKSLFLCMWCSWINFIMNIYVFVLCIFI